MEQSVSLNTLIKRHEGEDEFILDHIEEVEHLRMAGKRFKVAYNQLSGHFELVSMDEEGKTIQTFW